MYSFVLCYILVTPQGRRNIFILEVKWQSTIVNNCCNCIAQSNEHGLCTQQGFKISEIPTEILLFHASQISYIEELFSLFLKIFH